MEFVIGAQWPYGSNGCFVPFVDICHTRYQCAMNSVNLLPTVVFVRCLFGTSSPPMRFWKSIRRCPLTTHSKHISR